MENVTFSPSAFSTAIKPSSAKRFVPSELRDHATKDETSSSVENHLESFRMSSALPRTMAESTNGEITLENSKMSPQSNGSSTVLPLLTTSSGVFALHLSETRNEEAMSIGSEEAKGQTQSGMNDVRSLPLNVAHSQKPVSQTDSQVTLAPPSGQSHDLTPPTNIPVSEPSLSQLTLEAQSWINSNKTFHSYFGSSMIEDETEPTVMREAAEFSLDHSRKMSGGSGQSTGCGDDFDKVQTNESITEDSYSVRKHSDDLVPSSDGQSPNVITAEETVSTQIGLSAYLVPSTPVDSLTEAELTTQEWTGSGGIANGIHNPFDSNSDISQDFEDLDIGIQDKVAVLNQLKLDEQLLNQETPPSFDSTFTVPSGSISEMVVPGEEGGADLSVTTYFKEKSYPLGASLSANNSLNERPLFSSDHQIVSPPSRTLPPISELSDSDSPHKAVAFAPSPASPLSQGVVSSMSTSLSVNLTPLITSMSPGTANLPIPKLDLTKLLSNVSPATTTEPSVADTSCISCQSSETVSVPNQSNISLSHQTTGKVSSSNIKPDESPLLPPTPSPHAAEIPSLYFRESCGSTLVEDSTITVSDISTFPLTPAPSKLQFDVTTNAPTPSIMGITQLFNFTEVNDTLEDLAELHCVPREKGGGAYSCSPSDITRDNPVANISNHTLLPVTSTAGHSSPSNSTRSEGSLTINGSHATERSTALVGSSDSTCSSVSDEGMHTSTSQVNTSGGVAFEKMGGDSESISSNGNLGFVSLNTGKEVGLTTPTKRQKVERTLPVGDLHVVTLRSPPTNLTPPTSGREARSNSVPSKDCTVTLESSSPIITQQPDINLIATPQLDSSPSQRVSVSFSVLDKPHGQSTSTNSPQSSSSPLASRSATTSPHDSDSCSGTPSPPSINTLVTQSASKRARIKAILDATRFDAQKFLASLENRPPFQVDHHQASVPLTHSASLPAIDSDHMSTNYDGPQPEGTNQTSLSFISNRVRSEEQVSSTPLHGELRVSSIGKLERPGVFFQQTSLSNTSPSLSTSIKQTSPGTATTMSSTHPQAPGSVSNLTPFVTQTSPGTAITMSSTHPQAPGSVSNLTPFVTRTSPGTATIMSSTHSQAPGSVSNLTPFVTQISPGTAITMSSTHPQAPGSVSNLMPFVTQTSPGTATTTSSTHSQAPGSVSNLTPFVTQTSPGTAITMSSTHSQAPGSVSNLTPFITTQPTSPNHSDLAVTHSPLSSTASSSLSGSHSDTLNNETLKPQSLSVSGDALMKTVSDASDSYSLTSTNEIFSSSYDQLVHSSPIKYSTFNFTSQCNDPVATPKHGASSHSISASQSHTHYSTPQNHTPINSKAPCKMSLAYATPLLSSSEAQTSFHALPMVNASPQTLPSISPPSSYLATPLLATKPLPVEIEAPEIVTFEGVSCIFTRHFCQFSVRNKTDRWIQSRLDMSAIRRDASEVVKDTHKVFDSPSKCFIGPNKEEVIKISFTPLEPGSYTALLNLMPHISSSSALPLSGHTSLATIQIQASAEEPKIQILTPQGDNSSLLDYGVVLAGTTPSLPLYLVNHGQGEVPLCLAMALNTPSWFCFSFGSSSGSRPSSTSVPVPLESHNSNTRLVRLTIPGKPVGQVESTVHSLMVHFSPVAKQSSHNSFGLSHPEVFSSRIDLYIDGPVDTSEGRLPTISSLQLKATVGVARLHAPRSMQYVSLSCDLGSSISQSIPIKNVGNVPIRVRILCDQDSGEECFTVRPDQLDMNPNKESHIQVQFRPLQTSKEFKGALHMCVEPDGPSYQIQLRGVAKDPVIKETSAPEKGLLECNRYSLFWAGVDIGHSSIQDLVIRSTYTTNVVLEAKIRDPEIFKLQTTSSPLSVGLKISLDPGSQDTIHVQYTPSSISLQKSFIDIIDTTHNRRYEIPVFGYGGRSSVRVTNCQHSTDHGLVASIGQVVPNQQSIMKLKVVNTGQRAAFVRVIGYPAVDEATSSPLPEEKLRIIPEKIMIHPQQSREVVLIYCAKNGDLPPPSPGDTVPLVRLVLYTGDEIVRRLVTSLSSHDSHVGDNKLLSALRGYFTEQDTVPSDFEHVPLEGIKTKNLLESNTQTLRVLITGRVGSSHATPTSLSLSPPHITHPYSHHSTPASSSASSAPPLSNRVLPSHSIKFSETAVKHFGESFLEMHNPFSVSMKWRLSSSSPSFVKEVEGSGSVHKAKYSPFWVYQCSGEIDPLHQITVRVTFQPQDAGSYTQIWNLEVQGEGIGVRKFTLSFSGECYPTVGPRQKLFPAPSLSSVPSSSITPVKREVPSVSSDGSRRSLKEQKKLVYLGSDHVEFPVTEVGQQEALKLRVINKDTCCHQFQVIKPHPPFSVLHYEFELKSNEYARLPIYFTPSEESRTYESIIAIRTHMGHQMFAVLTGRSA